MRRLPLLLVIVALLAGCAWDGPPRDVRVVPSVAGRPGGPGAEAGEAAEAADPSDESAGSDPAGVPGAPDEPLRPGLDDRPAALGVLSMPEIVAVVGDSLTVSATAQIVEALTRAGVRTVLVDGRQSRRMVAGSADLPSGVAAIEEVLAEHDPDLWVVALGTNDVGAGVNPEQFVGDLRTTVAAIPRTAPLVWVDVWIRDRLEEVVDVNSLLRTELGRRRASTVVVDWFSSAAVDGVITGDGIHLTETGQERFASVIADAVITTALEVS